MPSELQGPTWKFACPFHGPFRILSLTDTNAEVKLIDEPHSSSIFVSLQRIRPCHDELPDTSWRGQLHDRYTPCKPKNKSAKVADPPAEYHGPVTRSRSKNSEN